LLNREQLDRRMAAWEMYYIEHMATTTIARHFKVSRQSIPQLIVSLGGELGDDDIQRAMRDRGARQSRCGPDAVRECDVITPAHDSDCARRVVGEENADDERAPGWSLRAGGLSAMCAGGDVERRKTVPGRLPGRDREIPTAASMQW
jgi:hypothetical protein